MKAVVAAVVRRCARLVAAARQSGHSDHSVRRPFARFVGVAPIAFLMTGLFVWAVPLAPSVAAASPSSPGRVVAWGDGAAGQTTVPAGLTDVTAIAGGGRHALALKSDGTVAAWGELSYVPPDLTDVTAVSAGWAFDLALKGDHTVVAWGADSSYETNVPTGLSNVTAIAAGDAHALALKSDGTVVAWGDNTYGQVTVP